MLSTLGTQACALPLLSPFEYRAITEGHHQIVRAQLDELANFRTLSKNESILLWAQ